MTQAPERGPGSGSPATSEETETADRVGAFPRLADAQIEELARHGERRRVELGDLLFREGETTYDFFVILEGKVAIVAGYGHDERVIAVHGARRFLGELNLLIGHAVYLTAVVRERGEVLVVPAATLRELVQSDQALGDVILRAFMLRRAILIGLGAGIKIVGSRFARDSRRLREFVVRNRLPHAWIDLEEDRAAAALLEEFGVAPADTPVVIRGEEVLRNPTNAELARSLGIGTLDGGEETFDLAVVGAGPAGLAAAVYGASEGLSTVLVEAVATGGQAGTASRIENYLGFPAGIPGSELAARAAIQATKFGARFLVPAEAVGLEPREGYHAVRLADGGEVVARAVVIATGARYRKLAVPRLEEFEGVGVYYAATQMEAELCEEDPVVVVGGGNAAGQAALFLAERARSVRLLIRGDTLERTMSRYLSDQLERTSGVDVLLHTEVRELLGERALEGVVVEDSSGERRALDARALFVLIGAEPHTRWLQGEVALDEDGFVLTGRESPSAAPHGLAKLGRAPFPLETSRPGVLAAGDVRRGSIKRVAAAVGEGSMAVRLVHQYLAATSSPLSAPVPPLAR